MTTERGRRDTASRAHFHAVRFYDSQESLCRTVVEFLGEGLAMSQPALVVATPEHRLGIVRELRERRFDVERLQTAGDLLLMDARDALSTFMVDGLPDAALFAESVSATIDRVCRGRRDCTTRAYGEMVDVLWKDGHSVAAVRLEMLWNKLAATHDFSLLCGYAMGNFYKGTDVADIHHQHTHTIDHHGASSPVRQAEA